MSTPLLSQLLDALGPSPLRLITAPASAEVPVSGVLIHEPRAALPAVPHGMLFAVGAHPASAEAAYLAAAAARAGHAALVVKCYGEPVTALAAAGGQEGVAVLAADDDMAWQLLDALVSSALAALSRSSRHDAAPAVGDLFALANAIAAQIGGATAIEDPLRRILAYSTLPDQPIDEHRRQGILGLRVPHRRRRGQAAARRPAAAPAAAPAGRPGQRRAGRPATGPCRRPARGRRGVRRRQRRTRQCPGRPHDRAVHRLDQP
jgi:hypothetical protein